MEQLLENIEETSKLVRIYETYRQTMYYTASSILTDPSLAEDAVHNAFLKIMHNLHKIQEEDIPRTRAFIITITKNTALSMKDRQVREILCENLDDTLPDKAITPEGQALETDMEQRLDRLITSMKPEYQEILDLVFFHGLKIGEAAKVLGISGTAARKRLQRAKADLKRRIKEENFS